MASLVGQKLGQYEILEEIGKGGMAVVYRAHQESMARDVAVKVIASQMADSPDFIARFEREAKTIAALQHPHILPVYDYGNVEGQIFLVMRLVEGGSLDRKIRNTPLPMKQAGRMLTQIASALSYAHDHGVIHRDLKPNNILLDSKDNPYLTDFGIAKLLQQETRLTATGSVMGTPSYMSPEQWRGEEIDARSDVYALGIMFYEMITGQLPFTGDTPYSLMYQHFDTPLPSPVVIRPDLPESITKILQKATAKRKEDRYASAEQFAEAVNDVMTSAPTRPGVNPADHERTFIPGGEGTQIQQPMPGTRPAQSLPPNARTTASDQPANRLGLAVILGTIATIIAIFLIVGLISRPANVATNSTATGAATKNVIIAPTLTSEIQATTTESANTKAPLPVNMTATPDSATDSANTTADTTDSATASTGTDGATLVFPIGILRQDNTVTVYVPGNRLLNLSRITLQSTTVDGKVLSQKLSEIPTFIGLPFDRIRAPICFRLKGTERGPTMPRVCRELPASKVFIAELAPSDMFYYDTVANEPRTIVILRDDEVVGECAATANECQIDIPIR